MMHKAFILTGLLGALLSINPLAVAHNEAHHGHTQQAAAQLKDLSFGEAWSKELPPTAQNGIAFFSVTNTGKNDDKLIAAAAPVIAESAEIHAHIHENDLMRMVKVDDLEVAAGQTVVLEPSGYHIMLMGLKRPLVAGEQFPLQLTFEQSGEVELTVTVRPNDVVEAEHHHHH